MTSDEISEHEELNEILRTGAGLDKRGKPLFLKRAQGEDHPVIASSQPSQPSQYAGLSQYSSCDGLRFFPASCTVPELPHGVYEIQSDNMKGLFFHKLDVKTDGLIRFPETNSEKVIQEIGKFWDREDAFVKHGLNYKRGIILWGPPGSGKSCTIQLVMSDVINRGGCVFKFTYPNLYVEGIRMFREIQPKTPVVCLMEDIDSIIEQFNESEVLNLLDGVDQIEKVVYLATTNYPERLGPRIMNRPSRFDRRYKMGHPKPESRKLYFQHLIDEETLDEFNIDLERWVDDTEDMSIAHLKDLFTSVCIFGNEYEESVEILMAMVEERPHSKDDSAGVMGLGFTKTAMRKKAMRKKSVKEWQP